MFEPPVGPLFYRYARRRNFIESFSVRQLFADAADADDAWLAMLEEGAANPASRYAVFSFFASFWRKDYTERMASLNIPTLVTVADLASSISRSGKTEAPQDLISEYLKGIPQAEAKLVKGLNVLPYESTTEFVKAIAPFI